MHSFVQHEPTKVKHRGTLTVMATDQKDTQIGIRLPRSMRDAWAKAAAADGRSLSSWVIARCNGLPTTAPVIEPDPEPSPRRRKTR